MGAKPFVRSIATLSLTAVLTARGGGGPSATTDTAGMGQGGAAGTVGGSPGPVN